MDSRINGGLIHVNIPDRATLQASYMSFVQGGGLFIPSRENVSLADEVFVLATLPEQTLKIPLTGKVIWISRKQAGIKPQGFAIQLSGERGAYYKVEAEKILAGSMSSDRSNFTM